MEGDLLILCIGSYGGGSPSCVLALDKDSGKEVWKTPTEGLTNSSPIAITAGGKRQVIVWTQKSVMSLDPATGSNLLAGADEHDGPECGGHAGLP